MGVTRFPPSQHVLAFTNDGVVEGSQHLVPVENQIHTGLNIYHAPQYHEHTSLKQYTK